MEIFTTVLVEPLANGLALFYKFFGQNMGIAILLFSLALRILLTPLTRPYMESMKKMKKYSSELAKLKKKHGGNKSKQMQAQADFYKERGINPSAGCLPYLLQIVVLIALFNVFNRILRADGDIIVKFNELLYEPLRFGVGEVLNTKFLYLDVTKPDVFRVSGVPIPIPGPILLLAALVQLISSKVAVPYIEAEKRIAKKTPEKSDDLAVNMQSSMMYTFPLITIVIGINFPSGLALYWLLFSLFQFWQQYQTYGWGGATPWIRRLGLVNLHSHGESSKEKDRRTSR